MGPSKKKGSVRRQVLDLNTREDSPSRPTWQTKYQHVLPVEGAQQNGDVESSSSVSTSVKNNPLSGLLMNYNSDSDSEETTQKPSNNLNAKVEDFLKEIQSISVDISDSTKEKSQAQIIKSQNDEAYPSALSSWQQCYDQNSGYYYYWNIETNEVTWEMPTCLKTAIASAAAKQPQPQPQPQSQPQQQQQQTPSEPETKKKVCKYPWQTESDSEDEKIEMITFFGSQSGDESENEQDKSSKKSSEKVLAPKLPSEPISLAPEDPERINESSYETSSLLAHGVQDTGPPGDESFQTQKEPAKVPVIKKKEDTSTNDQLKTDISGPSLESKNLSEPNNSDQSTPTDTQEIGLSTEKLVNTNKFAGETNADDVIAQIEKETPPDYGYPLKSENSVATQKIENVPLNAPQSPNNSKTSSFALIANYGDDSESEENNICEKRKNSSKIQMSSSKPIFPIKIPQETNKPLFPCADIETPKLSVELQVKEKLQEPEPVNNIYNVELELSDPAAHKAFKRKKRIEFATTVYGPSTSSSKYISPVKVPTTQYNLDPDSNDHHGFGFNALKNVPDSERKTYKNNGGIQFIKGETINLSSDSAPKEKSEAEPESLREPKTSLKESVKNEEIEEAATLLREKVNFLIGGKNEISPIQQMAIELETLVLAWQSGVLTPSYLLRWLNDKCGELIRHEKTAAPAGWTCLWDRKSKRYFYRNSTTKAIQWEYPCVEEKVKTKEEVEDGGDEMDICDTPPHLSPVNSEKQTDEPPSTPPPPVISEVADNTSSLSPTPQPPSPPQISFSSDVETSSAKYSKKKKRKADEISTNNEVDVKTSTIQQSSTTASCDQSSKKPEGTPPLPPMPPPPPPPPDESPPPLPESPPPLPLDPDQPLPPGVDEPEYSLYRTKHSYKKSQPDSAAYSAELMLTYGYGLPVQPVVPSATQGITMPMQPLEYHTYMPDPATNPYLVQSAPSSHVIHCPAKKPKPSLTSELVSFYSDLAELDSPSVNTNSDSNSHTVSSSIAPHKELVCTLAQTTSAVSTVTTTSSASAHSVSSSVTSSTAVKSTESTTSNGVNVKKKKKAKTSSGLALKKKGVSSLVAKWQQVQQEVRRDFSDDDDDIPANR